MIASAPEPDTTVPAAVERLAGGRPVRAVWRNELDGLTFELGTGLLRTFAKWQPAGCPIDLAAEADRLRWAAPRTPVPGVLGQGADEHGTWLVTAALPGHNAVSPRWLAEPERAVLAIGRGLRAMHDALPVDACPFGWSAPMRATRAAEHARRYPDQRCDEFAHLDLGEAVARLRTPPPVDRLVVCHGDACAPNTLLTDDGAWSGHVDLGALGVADRWSDLAVATWSTQWNYGPGWEDTLLDAYGIEPDPERTAYYRLLWDLCP